MVLKFILFAFAFKTFFVVVVFERTYRENKNFFAAKKLMWDTGDQDHIPGVYQADKGVKLEAR